MTLRKVYYGSLGPFYYDDTDPIDDEDGDFAGEDQKGLITNGPVKVENVPTEDFDVLRLNDLGELIVSSERVVEIFAGTGTINYLSNVIYASGTYDLFLPTHASGEKRVYDVKNVGSGIITLKPNAGDGGALIEGETFQSLRPGYNITVVSDATDWWVL